MTLYYFYFFFVIVFISLIYLKKYIHTLIIFLPYIILSFKDYEETNQGREVLNLFFFYFLLMYIILSLISKLLKKYTKNKILINLNLFPFVLLIMLIIIGAFSTYEDYKLEKEAKMEIMTHLKNKYGEEFEIGEGGRKYYAEDYFEYKITPKSYEYSKKSKDKYYNNNTAIVDIGVSFGTHILEGVGDTYKFTLLKESANYFYREKLIEIFGDNVLPVLEVGGVYADDKNFLNSVRLTKESGERLTIEGGIYIFDNLKDYYDKEIYRDKIFQFIQHMKSTGTFEYVNLNIYVCDGRIFSKAFSESESIKEEFRKYDYIFTPREKRLFLDRFNKSYEEAKSISWEISELNRGNIDNEIYHTYFLIAKISSPKYAKSNNWSEEFIYEYDDIADVRFIFENI